MDTMELNHDNLGKCEPVVWRNKSPQDLYRERYSECLLEKPSTAPKSLSHQAQGCDLFLVREKDEAKGSGRIKAHLIPLPEKP